MTMFRVPETTDGFDVRLRRFIYRHFIQKERAPSSSEMAAGLKSNARAIKAGLGRLSQSHAIVLQENGELWRAAPFSAVPTAFPVEVGRRSYWANCIWDALGIPAMLRHEAVINTSCGCCNLAMDVKVEKGRVAGAKGMIHFAVPARHWYQDIVFT
jgi:alkylmercury lyase-like protein